MSQENVAVVLRNLETFEHDEELLGSGLLCGAARQRVLNDSKPGALRQQLVSKRLELFVRQAAIVGDDERLGRAELSGELLDDPFLVRF